MGNETNARKIASRVLRIAALNVRTFFRYLDYLPIFGILTEKLIMKNTSISLGNYFDQFVRSQISTGRYKNVSEVVRAGLRLLENEESKAIALRNAIEEGMNSPRVENFDFDAHLKKLKAERSKNG